MELKEKNIYSTKEMMKFFGVSKDTWKKNKDKLLNHFRHYYMYEVYYDETDRRKINYRILKKLNDYESPLKKGEKRDLIYDKKIEEVISADNIQTAKNISRIIKNDKEIAALNHTDNTRYEYTRLRMRNMFGIKKGGCGSKGIILDKVWCKLDIENNKYIRLTPEEIKRFYDIYGNEKKLVKEYELTIVSDFANGLIGKEEMNELIGEGILYAFICARREYKSLYGFTPIKVPVYALSAFYSSEMEAA